jgi:hypothetical protein
MANLMAQQVSSLERESSGGCREKRDNLRNHGVCHTVGAVCATAPAA